MSYPNPLATNAEKDAKEYGLQYAKYIAAEWLSSAKYSKRNAEFEENDTYCEDRVNTKKFKELMGMADSRTWTGMSWDYVTVVPKFLNVVKNSLKDDLFAVRAVAVDAASSEERNRYRKRLMTAMYAGDVMKQVGENTGVNYMPNYVPETPDELDLHMQLRYKQPREIASEILIQRIEEVNGITEINSELKEDLLRYGVAVAKVMADPNYGTVIERCNPKTMVYSSDPKQTRNKKGAYYYASMEAYRQDELLRISEGELTEKSVMGVGNMMYQQGIDGTINDTNQRERLINVMHFCFKTTIKDVYKRKKNNLIKKDDTFSLPAESKSEIISGYRDVWYEGYYIPGTEIVFGYKLMKDMVRKNNDIMKVLPPYIMYQISTPCLVSQIKSYNDDAFIALLKLRHLVLAARPQGYEINIDALQKIDIGGGNVLAPIDVIDIYNQTGNLLYSSSSFDEDNTGYQNNMRLIQSTLGTDIGQLINIYNHALNMCYEVTGVNRVRDGSNSTANTLVSVSEIALAQSNTATELYLDAMIDMSKRMAEIIINRAQQLTRYEDNLCSQITELFFNEKDEVKNEALSLHKYNFDTIIDMQPTQQEKQQLQINIQNAVQAGLITLEDAIDINTIKNIKLAGEYVKIVMDKRTKQAKLDQMAMEQARIQAQAQADLAIKQAEIQKTQLELEAKSNSAQIEAQTKIAIIQKQAEADMLLMDRKYQYELQLAGMQVQANTELNKFKEEAKDKRIVTQAEQQSKMITQRQYHTNPIKFNKQPEQNVTPQEYQTLSEQSQL